MVLKSIKVKLNTNPENEVSLKRLAGAYRKIYNLCMDAQYYRVIYNSPKNHFISGTELAKVIKLKDYPFLRKLDKGVLTAASNTASLNFKLKFDYTLKSIPYLSRKKTRMKFRTNGNVRIHEDYIEIPKTGRINLYESGRIPPNISPSRIYFSHDGVNWFVSVLIEEEYEKTELSEEKVSLDFTDDGNVILNNTEIDSITNSKRFKRIENKLKKVQKKLRRQNKLNSIIKHGVEIPVTTKNSKKTKKTLDKLKNKLYNIKQESFNKLVKEVAITKPRELHLLGSEPVKQLRHGYLTRKQRKTGSKQFLNMLVKKLKLIGTNVIQHNSLKSFQETLGYRD